MNIFRVLYRYMRKTNFIVLCIISILLFFSLIVGNIENITRSILEVNNQLTKNHIGIGFNDELENKEVIELINKIKSNKNIIIKYYLQNGFDYDIQSEGIFFNGVFNNSYNLLDGRFFTTEDFNKNNKLAVIGKDVLKYTKVNGNKRYIFRGLDRYEVIGIIGKDDLSSKYDNKIIYNLDSILNDDEILNKYTWWVDSYDKNKSEIKDIISNIGNNALIQIIDSTATPPNPLQEALTLSKTLITSFILIILCILLTLVRSIIYWLDSIALEIGVRKNYGATNKEIFIDIIKRYILISIFSLFIAFISQLVFSKLNFLGLLNYKFSFINLILSIFFIIILGIVFISIAMYKISRIQINKLLKEL